MRNTLAISQRELLSIFCSPIAYIVIFGFLFVTGVLVIGLGWGLARLLSGRQLARLLSGEQLARLLSGGQAAQNQGHRAVIRKKMPELLLIFGVTVFVFGSALLIYAPALSAAGASVPAWLAGWRTPTSTSALLTFTLALLYEPLIVLFALPGLALLLLHDRRARLLLSWAVCLL